MLSPDPSKPSVTLHRRLNAPPARVYEAWTDPLQIAKWFGPARVVSVEADVDMRVGGRYDFRLRTDDGEEHGVGGVYEEIVPGKKLVFTWAWRSTPERESLVTVTFKAEGKGTLLTLTHERFFDEGARERHQGGWMGSLDKLERYFADAAGS
jgi:uncharacterized protein YndB with AHSA1/START domain